MQTNAESNTAIKKLCELLELPVSKNICTCDKRRLSQALHNQGVQYSARLLKKALEINGITQSMRGCCWDNAVQERFFRNLKTACLNDLSLLRHQSVTSAADRYRYDNHQRLNSAIDYVAPVQKRQAL